MPAQWTADVIGQMHINGIKQTDLAEHMGMTREYVSMVLNGKRSPKKAEEKFRQAVSELTEQRVK